MYGDIKPVRYLKANAIEVAQELKEGAAFISSDSHDEGTLGAQSVVACKRDEQTLAMLQLLKMGRRDIDEGKTLSIEEAFSSVRKQLGLTIY